MRSEVNPMRIRFICLLAVVSVSSSSSSLAQLSLDQCSFPSRNINAFVGNQAQTFTVGMSGYFTAFDVYASRIPVVPDPQQTLVWEIRSTFGPVPRLDPSGVLATGSVPLSSLPGDASFVTIQIS